MPLHAATYRREGRADAAVMLVAARVFPSANLEDWARALNLTQAEVKAAIARHRAALETTKRREGRGGQSVECTVCGKRLRDSRALAAHGRQHQPRVPCPACGTPVRPGGIGTHRRYCTGEPT